MITKDSKITANAMGIESRLIRENAIET